MRVVEERRWGGLTERVRPRRVAAAEGQLPPAHARGARARARRRGAALGRPHRARARGDCLLVRRLAGGPGRARLRPRALRRPALGALPARPRGAAPPRGRVTAAPRRSDRQAARHLGHRHRGALSLRRRPRRLHRGAHARHHRARRALSRPVRSRRPLPPAGGGRAPTPHQALCGGSTRSIRLAGRAHPPTWHVLGWAAEGQRQVLGRAAPARSCPRAAASGSTRPVPAGAGSAANSLSSARSAARFADGDRCGTATTPTGQRAVMGGGED